MHGGFPIMGVPRFTILVNSAYCKGCEICVQVCPKKVLQLNEREKAVPTALDRCTGCLNCELCCPDFAIDVQEVAQLG